MRRRFSLAFSLLIASLLILSATAAVTADEIIQTYSGGFPANIAGTLPNQGTALLEQITLPHESNLTAQSTSYATGGFEPDLLLYDASGRFVDASSPAGMPDPGNGLIGDTLLIGHDLPAGNYTLAITDFLLNQSVFATNLSDGFTDNYGDGINFIDSNGNTRTGLYAVSLSVNAVPEPSTWCLVASGAATCAGFATRRRRATARHTRALTRCLTKSDAPDSPGSVARMNPADQPGRGGKQRADH